MGETFESTQYIYTRPPRLNDKINQYAGTKTKSQRMYFKQCQYIISLVMPFYLLPTQLNYLVV